MQLSVELNKKQLDDLQRELRQLPEAIRTRVLVNGINRTLPTVRTRATREITAETGLRAKYVRDRLKIVRASRARMAGTLSVPNRPIPMIAFGARQTARGVSYRLAKGAGRQMLGSAFIAVMPSGHRGVFKRKGRARLPIQQQFGPSLATVYSKDITAHLVAIGGDLEKNTLSQLDRVLQRRKADR